MDAAADPTSSHDFGKDILPRCLDRRRVVAWDFRDLNAKAARYWRDVGTLDAYYDANMDLVTVSPEFNLYDHRWPIRTRPAQAPPAKFVFAQEGQRIGLAVDSIVSPGCIVSGGRVNRSVLSPFVRVNSYCEIDESILLPRAMIGRYSRSASHHRRRRDAAGKQQEGLTARHRALWLCGDGVRDASWYLHRFRSTLGHSAGPPPRPADQPEQASRLIVDHRSMTVAVRLRLPASGVATDGEKSCICAWEENVPVRFRTFRTTRLSASAHYSACVTDFWRKPLLYRKTRLSTSPRKACSAAARASGSAPCAAADKC